MDELEQRIAEKLAAAADMAGRMGLEPGPAEHGLAVAGPGGELVLRLSLADIARIAAREAETWS